MGWALCARGFARVGSGFRSHVGTKRIGRGDKYTGRSDSERRRGELGGEGYLLITDQGRRI